MLLYVDLTNGKRLTIEVGTDDTVANVKSKVAGRGGPDPAEFDLVLRGRRLVDGKLIKESGIQRECTLLVSMKTAGDEGGESEEDSRLLGGNKGRCCSGCACSIL